MSASGASQPHPGARLGALAARYLAAAWLIGPLAWVLWILPPADRPPDGNDVARVLLAVRVGPLALALGEATRAAAAVMGFVAGDARQRALGHLGVITTGLLVGFALVPLPWLGLLALASLAARHAAAAWQLRERLAWASAVAIVAFGILAHFGDDTLVLIAFVVVGVAAALAELAHAVASVQSSSGGSGAS